MATSKKNGKSTEELMAPLNALISKGRRDGMLSSSELMAALEKMDLSDGRNLSALLPCCMESVHTRGLP